MKNEKAAPPRAYGRAADKIRPVRIELDAMKFAEGSALIELGDTKVLTSATVEQGVPRWMAGSGRGWVTGEYSMLPRATQERTRREVSRGRLSGRSAEIQRLIGRSLRAAIDLDALPEITVTVDCDVLQADGGTRTASITAAYAAAVQALGRLLVSGDLPSWPVKEGVAAVSVGLVQGAPLLDLDAAEDREAEVDMNIVATDRQRLIEIQGTGERGSFSLQENECLLELALVGIAELNRAQEEALAEIRADIEAWGQKARRETPPKDEKDLWGRP